MGTGQEKSKSILRLFFICLIWKGLPGVRCLLPVSAVVVYEWRIFGTRCGLLCFLN